MTTATTVTVTIPGCPDAGLSPNARLHWRHHAKLKRQAKFDAQLAALEVCGFAGLRPIYDVPLTVRVTIGWAKGRKTVDGDNALAMVKYHLDGLTGLIWTDDKLCTFLPVIQERDPEGRGFIVIEVWP